MKGLFKIYQFTTEKAEKISMMPNEPHIHEYEELLVGMEGKLEHFIDFIDEVNGGLLTMTSVFEGKASM